MARGQEGPGNPAHRRPPTWTTSRRTPVTPSSHPTHEAPANTGNQAVDCSVLQGMGCPYCNYSHLLAQYETFEDLED